MKAKIFLIMRIALFGPPGVGKGTQAHLLSERRGLRHISTGVMLRQAMAEGTPLGREAASYVNDGKLVPGEVVRKLAEAAIAETGYDDFVLDGYPRTVEQAGWLNEFLEAHKAPLHAVISIVVPDEVIVDRLSKRRVDRVTGENYHLDFKPPPPDLDPDRIFQRPDDRPEAIRKRLEVYRAETLPVEEIYEKCGKLYRVDGVGTMEEVYRRIEAVLEKVSGPVESGRVRP